MPSGGGGGSVFRIGGGGGALIIEPVENACWLFRLGLTFGTPLVVRLLRSGDTGKINV